MTQKTKLFTLPALFASILLSGVFLFSVDANASEERILKKDSTEYANIDRLVRSILEADDILPQIEISGHAKNLNNIQIRTLYSMAEGRRYVLTYRASNSRHFDIHARTVRRCSKRHPCVLHTLKNHTRLYIAAVINNPVGQTTDDIIDQNQTFKEAWDHTIVKSFGYSFTKAQGGKYIFEVGEMPSNNYAENVED